MRILVTGGGALLGQGIIRSLKMSDIESYIIVVDVNPLSSGLFWGNERYLVPLATDKSYGKSIEQLLNITKPDVVIVGTDVELLYFATNKEHLEKKFNTRIIVSSVDVIEVADDKLKTAMFFKEKGFLFPKSVDPNDKDLLDNLIETEGFPLIVKPRVGARSVGVQKVDNYISLTEAINNAKSAIVQECVGNDSQEYTASGLCFDGKCEAAIVMRRDLRDGNTYRTYYVDDSNLYSKVTEWTVALNPFGPANFQFRIDRNGNPKVFEINARFSGTTPLRALAGFNEVELCIRKIIQNEKIVQPVIRDITILRHWSETVVDSKDTLHVRKV